MQDLRYALRTLRRQPLFMLVAVLTLALGIGANTAIFSLVYQILLRPLPYGDPGRLVFIWNSYANMALPQANVSIPDYLDREAQAPAIEDAALFTPRMANLNEGGRPEQVRALAVTPSFFSTLQRQPCLGRGFVPDEAKPQADKYVVLTHGLWASHYASDPGIIGREIRINGEAYRVTGVMAPDFEAPAPNIAMLVPFGFTPQQMSDTERGNEFSMMIARLRPGATIAQLNGQMKTITDHIIERLPARAGFMRTSGFGGFAVSFRDELAGDVRTPLYVLQAGVLVVLLIACANVANLLLMRASGRSRELAIRSTLGAAQWRIVRQLIVEGLILAAAGAVAGLAVAVAGVRALATLTTTPLPGAVAMSLQAPVLLSAFVLAVLTGLVFGVVPAVAVTRGNAASFLKDDSGRGTAGRHTTALRAALVVAETALAVVLLVAAGLLVKSFAKLQDVKPGFSPANVLTAQISLPQTRYPDPASRAAFWTRLIERAQAIPGAMTVGLTTNVPFSGNVSSGSYGLVGRARQPDEQVPHGRQEIVGGDYFKAMQIPLVAGRTFTGSDVAGAPAVCVIDEYLVKRYFPDRSPLGHQITRGGRTSYTIVGVVGTINAIDLGQPVNKERIYYPAAQLGPRSMAVAIKAAVAPETLVSQVRSAVQAVDPEQPISDVRTMDQWIGRSLQNRRAPTLLLTLFGAVALLLSAIGIYGVLSFGVAQRGREFGIRQALGADRGSILSLVLTQGLRTAGLGVVLGVATAMALSRYLQSLLFGVTAHDAVVFASVPVVLLAVALAASYVPARRATRLDPMVALRDL